MVNDIEYLHTFSGHLSIFFGEMSIQIFCSVFNIRLLLSSCKSSLYILNTSLSSDIWFAKVFSHSVGCLFTFLIVSLEAFFFPFHFFFCHQFLFFTLMMSSESVFPFVACAFGVTARKPLPNRMAKRFMLMFPSRKRKWQPTPVSCLENSMDGEAWWATVHGVAKSPTWLSNFTFL